MVIHLVNDNDDDDCCYDDGNSTAGSGCAVVLVPRGSLPFIICHVFSLACDWTKWGKTGSQIFAIWVGNIRYL